MNMKWLGGFVDGEGCFSFAYRNGFIPEFSIANSHIPALHLSKELLGAGEVKDYGYNTCRYYIGGFKMLPILRALIPYLYVKKKQALLLIKFIELRQKANRSRYTLEELLIVKRISELHGRTETKLYALVKHYISKL